MADASGVHMDMWRRVVVEVKLDYQAVETGDPGRLVAKDEKLRDACDYRPSCAARSSCSIASRRPRLRSAFLADDSLCGLHSRLNRPGNPGGLIA